MLSVSLNEETHFLFLLRGIAAGFNKYALYIFVQVEQIWTNVAY